MKTWILTLSSFFVSLNSSAELLRCEVINEDRAVITDERIIVETEKGLLTYIQNHRDDAILDEQTVHPPGTPALSFSREHDCRTSRLQEENKITHTFQCTVYDDENPVDFNAHLEYDAKTKSGSLEGAVAGLLPDPFSIRFANCRR